MISNMTDTIPAPVATASHRSKEVAPFLKNLRAMLESESPAILRWTSDGRALSGHINRKKSVPNHLKVQSVKARRPKRGQELHDKGLEAEPLFLLQHQHARLRPDVTIKLPAASAMDASSSDRLSFASPTDVYSSELGFPPLEYNDAYCSSTVVDGFESIELDWVDTLYSSLNGAAKAELEGGVSAATLSPLFFDPSDASCFDLRL
ncbi:hypothetical protein PybrP1_006500 [[Pythium] brassicae (nom. inval.)]|nr:hypothetical protein PybrP1_006500 [[Pythium] brassicae (nom. inval.)]